MAVVIAEMHKPSRAPDVSLPGGLGNLCAVLLLGIGFGVVAIRLIAGGAIPRSKRGANSALFVLSATFLVGCSQSDPLPNGYTVFFASDSEAALVKDGINYGACLAGPHVAELGSSANYIFGRIEPKKGIPPHPDHSHGFFLIDSAIDKVTTGLDRDTWLTELKAVGVDSPQLHLPEHTWPRKY